MMIDANILHIAGWFVIVGFLWGGTNPLIKKGSEGLETIQRSNRFYTACAKCFFLLCRWKYVIPLLLNLSGSVLYFITLGEAEITLAGPIANAITLIFASLVGQYLGETQFSWQFFFGGLFIILGVFICVVAKSMEA
eukprot:GCRY01003580.1.p1 GENE.GCRY01003580.1~~GCRY01003580.1.p1  ORF type:complete len:137 (+),score=8.75 GCRY01003580.1:721-1131(+)